MLSEPAGVVQHSGDGATAVDGRSARRSRGRAAAVEAVLALFDRGDLRPSAEEIVAVAGISTASLFRYFRGLDELYRAAFEEQVVRAGRLARIDAPADLPLGERVERFVAGRIDVYESVAGVGRMARARAVDHPDVAAALDQARRRWLGQVRRVFGPELAGRSRADAGSLAAAVDAVTSFEAWDLLVGVRGTPRRAVEAHWRTALAALLR
jgi:AcrR family transcriptional regulator